MEWDNKPPVGPTPIIVGKPRKDGKQMVSFFFSAKRINKLLTAKAVGELLNNPDYQVRMGA